MVHDEEEFPSGCAVRPGSEGGVGRVEPIEMKM